MASVGISCSICSELYKVSDEILSTKCGHVFHGHCIRQWQARSLQCPSCRGSETQCIKIYLNFEEGFNESDKKVVELKSQLEQSILNASLLQQILDDSERDFLNIQKQFSEHEERMNELNKNNEYLILQNSSREKDIELKTIEIHRLQEALNASSPQGSCLVLQEEINLLKEKLKHMSLKLDKEIRNSIELIADKMKLQSMLEHATNSIKNTNALNQLNNSIQQNNTKQKNNLNKSAPKNKGCVQSVVIKNVRGTFTEETSIMLYIWKLIKIMNLSLKPEDVQEVSILEKNSDETLSLRVKFSSVSSKIMFLAKKNKLKLQEDTKNLILNEYVADYITYLLQEARTLKNYGYKHVFCKNMKVFVRKYDRGVNIRIDNKEDIEGLKRKASACPKEKLANTPTSHSNEVNGILHELPRSPAVNLRSNSPSLESSWFSFLHL